MLDHHHGIIVMQVLKNMTSRGPTQVVFPNKEIWGRAYLKEIQTHVGENKQLLMSVVLCKT